MSDATTTAASGAASGGTGAASSSSTSSADRDKAIRDAYTQQRRELEAKLDSSSLQKVKIQKKVGDDFQDVVDCTAQFNPEKLKLNKKSSWKTEKTWQSNIGNTVFAGGQPIKLSADLFFDTTSSNDGDVRGFTEPLMALTLVNLAEAGQTTSPAEIKSRLEAKKKEQEPIKKSLDDMKKNAVLMSLEKATRGAKDKNLAEAQQSHSQAEAEVKRVQDQRDAVKKEVDDLQQQLKDAIQERREARRADDDAAASAASRKVDALRASLKRAKAQAKIQLIALDIQLGKAREALSKAEQDLNEAKAAAETKTPYEQAKEDHDKLTKQIEDLKTQSKGLQAGKGTPPICKFIWGSFFFVAIMESVKVTYLMFRPNGTPVRAKAKIKMKQIEEESFYPPQNPTSKSAPRKVWIVRQGERLDWIAYQEYGDASMWRYIADINDLDDPFQLRPGQMLNLI